MKFTKTTHYIISAITYVTTFATMFLSLVMSNYIREFSVFNVTLILSVVICFAYRYVSATYAEKHYEQTSIFDYLKDYE